MNAADKHIDPTELLVKYLAGEVNTTEKQQAEKWIADNAANKRYYEHFKLIWDESLKLANNNAIDEDKAWGRFRERIQIKYVATATPANNYQWLKVAAVVLIASAAILFAVRIFKPENEVPSAAVAVTSPAPKPTILTSAAANKIKTDTLPDGSVITQNKNSTLRYPKAFTGKTRAVELSGEAFFNVRHNPGNPFTIKVNDVLITVLGTSFNVKSNGKTIEVVVETGVVSVQKQQQTATLYPGEKLTATTAIANFKKRRVTDNSYRYYFDKKAKSSALNQVKKDTFKRDRVIPDKP